MQRSRTSNIGRFFLVLGLILGLAACGTPEPEVVEPTATSGTTAVPSPEATATTEAMDSPLPTATPLPATPASGFGGAKGIIASKPAAWEALELTVFFAPFVGDENDEGVFILEPSIHPSKQIAPDGTFSLANIPPGRYVVVIGPTPDEAVAISEGDRPRIYDVLEGEILDLGAINL
ncbi:MAG TPA: hypothetical protein VLC52_12990 [Anaerolineae bacterium]|nr:hypothetical protein [Anaerolineae bacterium]